jgi:GNAT superfamily N-acetyltransferase
VSTAGINYVSGYPDGCDLRVADFFEGWPAAPGQATFEAALRGSHATEFAVDGDRRVVGFVNAISDGVATAFLPWLEVVPARRGQGVGSELVRRILARLSHLYSVDLVCDPELVAYYRRFGLAPIQGMGLRTPGNLAGATG